ncbi:Predicted oxidoreductase [Friedmanniella luteola]|uniref:Predicted oxidoreductase n=1 Tax=Friedmanniella luteola TaxID=546871 RepID=A0A1H1XKF3_9ACTN|nr:aldo/keto reductase [Friedmanniella luteola]SDT09718.1 Predicted oxidoreductase [Friedmanniella luteola]
MEYAKLGRSNMTVSKICLGTMHFGPKATEEESHAILDRALELGITFVDTANVYGGEAGRGRSEEIIGRWFASRPGARDEVVLATKVYHAMGDLGIAREEAGFSAYKVRKHLADSLRRLQTDRVDLYQVHHIDERVSAEELWGTYERVVADGSVLYAGSSNYSGWGLARAQMQAWQRGFVGFVSEQTQYNLLSRVPEMEVLPAAEAFGIGVIVYMPLAGGLLTGKTASFDGSRTQQVEAEYGISLGPENRQFADFTALCRELGEPEHVVATAWVLQHPAVTSAIVGVRTVAQLDGLDRAASLELDAAAMGRLDDLFDINRGRRIGRGRSPAAHAW